ncbi:inactive transglutaminase family protein [Teredinibacter franksiae]|uniref:inactive transglutaminase family protein n=1 Tax=Teredinibacter franksiae TaxID=2761453 RepID=UPI00162AAD92|nr:inactive transglutaminase family protein [Teredinibacter franksiae]
MVNRSRASLFVIVGLLLLAGSLLTWYRHQVFDVPFLPGEKRQVWSIEAKVEFLANGEPVKASLAIPASQTGFERIGEHTASPGYGLAYLENDGERRAQWSIRSAWGAQSLYYRVDMQVNPDLEVPGRPPSPAETRALPGAGPHETSALQLLTNALERSADNFTLARELITEFGNQAQSAQFLAQKKPLSLWMVQLLQHAGVPAQEVLTLALEDGRRRQQLNTYIQVFDGDDYQLFNPLTGRQGSSRNRLLWEYQSGSLLDIVGGSQSRVMFSVIEQEVPMARVLKQVKANGVAFLDFSIHSLPVEEQTMFKGILLIPVGVLVVVFMRVLIGLRTTGTFMPVLIAISFIQTSLLTGIIGFILIVGFGLIIRSYFSHLNLLLVARISAVIITVISIIAVFALLSFQLGLSEGLKITFFPMIILSWTIERMSILWEEEGSKEVLVQAGGSLLVALAAYGVMINDIVRHLTFNFIGLQLVSMALVILLGSYTGYRLLELRRFRVLSD